MENNEMIDSLSWYGAILKNEKNKPVLFPANRMGYIMDGAEISDEEGYYQDLDVDKFSMVKCYFLKDGIPISPEQASEDFNYQGLGFQISDICQIGVSNLGIKITNLFEYYQEDIVGFKEMLEYVMVNFLEQEISDKKYLAFAIMKDDEGELSPALYCMNKFGKFCSGFSYNAQSKIFETTDGANVAKILEVQFKDGTVPIGIEEAFRRMELEPDNIFISAEHLGLIELKDEHNSWEEALEKDADSTLNTLRMGMYAVYNKNQKEEEA